MRSQGLPKFGSLRVLHFMSKKRLVNFCLDSNQTTVLKRRTFPHLLIYALQCLLWVYFKEMQIKNSEIQHVEKIIACHINQKVHF